MSRVWFITGTSKGLGLRIAEAALQDGDSVVATARNPDTLRHLVDKYGSDRVFPLALDVNDKSQVLNVVAEAVKKFGRLDVVVNNAGYADSYSLEDSSIESFEAQVATNFFGVVYVTKAVIPVLRKQGSGRILQVSSLGGRMSSPGLSAYQSAKWAVGGFSGVVAQEVAPFGIKVTVLEPGGINTDWAVNSEELPVSEGYKQTVGEFNKLLARLRPSWSDPAALAQTIVKISKVDEPPLRLLLGLDTIPLAKQAAENLAASDEKWQAATKLSL